MYFIPKYILILLLTITVDYLAAIYMERVSGAKRKLLLLFSIVATCAILAVFKYYNFFGDNFAALGSAIGIPLNFKHLDIILPLGLSFHTFQSLSYVIEVYRGNQKAERNFGIYSLYVLFFPQLVAGPIERPQNLLHQFRELHQFDYSRAVSGLQLIGWGLVKKVVVADRLALLVDQVYAKPQGQPGIVLMTATVFFAFQIYADFSGYSDIARGCARILGFDLMLNFRRPYLAQSFGDFWGRWHISLSTWFRDYVYFPLGGSRVSFGQWQKNLLIVFLVSGFWHGAQWTYVIWGGLNALFIIFENISHRLAPDIRLPKLIARLLVFALICISWIFFRAQSVSDGLYIVANLWSGTAEIISRVSQNGGLLGLKIFPMNIKYMALSGILIIGMMAFEVFQEKVGDIKKYWATLSTPVRWASYYACLLILFTWGIFGKNQFIYFQF